MSKIESIMARRLEMSQTRIARVLPLIEKIRGAVADRNTAGSSRVHGESLLWRRQLMIARAVLDGSALNLMLAGGEQATRADAVMFARLRDELAELIDAVERLSAETSTDERARAI